MITLKLKYSSNFYHQLFEKWNKINELSSLIDISDLALNMLKDNLSFERVVLFVREDETDNFRVKAHRGYSGKLQLNKLEILSILYSGQIIAEIQDASAVLINSENKPLKVFQPLLQMLEMKEAFISLISGGNNLPYGIIMAGGSGDKLCSESLEESFALTAFKNLVLHFSHAVKSATFYKNWECEKSGLNSNILLRTKQITEEKQRFEAIFNNTKDGIAILDLHTTAFLDANPAFINLTGFTRAELMRTSCLEITTKESLTKTRAVFDQLIREGHVVDFMKECIVAAGRIITVNMSMAMMYEKQQILVSVKDMTQRHYLEQELLKAKEFAESTQITLADQNRALEDLAHNLELMVAQRTKELESALITAQEATSAKSKFLATMSHEIRTPMNGVLGMTELLANTELNSEQAELLNILKSSGKTLLSIIDDILDFSKIEAGKLDVEKIPFDFHSLMKEISEVFTLQANERGLDFILKSLESIPVKIIGDPLRLKQVLSNLIFNAIKFTNKGLVEVEIKRGSELNTFIVSIKDTGIGIDSDSQNQLFNTFAQANSTITRNYGGTGLGLAISSMLVKLMGGKIWMESEPNIGSTFYFTFKAEEIELESIQTVSQLHDHKNIGSLKILLAEDHAINRLLISKFLNQVNIQPDIAFDGLEVMEKMKGNKYDVILMDVQMPNMDGITASIKIREMNDIKQPYIVAITANAYDEDKMRCQNAGMDYFISKPVSYKSLIDVLRVIDQKLFGF